jgi:ADP-ribose pyrophosphatase YjhB (NUDIX family)
MVAAYAGASAGAGPQYGAGVFEQQQVVAWAVLPTGEACPAGLVGHGEHPRVAAVGAAADERGLHVGVTGVREVTSSVATATGTVGDVSVHTLGVAYDAILLADPLPTAPLVTPPDPAPAGSPRVQRAGAYAVLHHDGRLLLTRLAYTGTWTLPGGGIDHGEHPSDAVRREVHEETGLPLTGARLLDVDSVHFTGHGPDGTLEDFHAVRVLYTGTVPLDVEPRVVEVGGSSDSAAWVPISEIGERERRRFEVALRHVV